MKIITLLTDFGKKDSYVAQMKGIASSITNARIIDITHEIKPHNTREAAYILRTAAPYYPNGTIHVAVVDPGVGSQRKGLIITTKKHILIGPDNGILMPTSHHLGEFTIYEIKNHNYTNTNQSNTFHGRDIFMPIAAHITNGIPFDQFGTQTKTYVDLDFGKAELYQDTIKGKVIYIDHFGNIITNIPKTLITNVIKTDEIKEITIGEKQVKLPFVKSYSFVKKHSLLMTIGSQNFLEISMNQGNAAKKLSIKNDDEVTIQSFQ